MQRLLAQKPEDWCYVDGSLRFLPAHAAAEKLGLRHELFIADETAPVYLSNLEFLYALYLQQQADDEDRHLARVLRTLRKKPCTIYELCATLPSLDPPQIYRWLATQKLYGPFKAQLIWQEDVFRLFACKDDAVTFEKETLEASRIQPEMRDDALAALVNATPKQLKDARNLRDRFQEVVEGLRRPTRNEYRYVARYREAVASNGHILSAFLPNYPARGNRQSRLTKAQEDVIADAISTRIKKGRPLSNVGLAARVNAECEAKGFSPVSQESVRLRMLNRVKKEDLAQALLGMRGYHNALRPVSAKHATLRTQIPGLIAHVDSTQLDTRVWAESRFASFLECPWIYAFHDEATSRAQGASLGFGKSDRFALARAIRDAARRRGRLATFFFSDLGPEYQSTWWEMLLAQDNICKYSRPAGAPRFGGLQESNLKQLNMQVAHALPGSTWPDQHGRSASGSKKSRATARLIFSAVAQLTFHYLFEESNKTRHGTADASPDDLWDLGRAQYGEVGFPVTLDLAFLISTSVPVKVDVGERKGLRVGYREYWHDDLNGLRKPLRLEEARLDPETPTILYVKVKDHWFVTEARDHTDVKILPVEGRILEHYRVRTNAAATRRDGGSRSARMAKRIDELEASAAALAVAQPSNQPAPEQSIEPEREDVDLDEFDDIPGVSSDDD